MRATLTRPTQETGETTTTMSLLDIAGIAGLSTVIAIHTTELAGKTEETSYLGFGYVLLGLASAATIIGFVLTRTTGLPKADGDVGNWSETIAVWSLFAEGLVVLLAIFALVRSRRA
jgi:hypothetical protein